MSFSRHVSSHRKTTTCNGKLLLGALATCFFYSLTFVGSSIRSLREPISRATRRSDESDSTPTLADYEELADQLGFVMPTPTSIDYKPSWTKRISTPRFGLMMVPHVQDGLINAKENANIPDVASTSAELIKAETKAGGLVAMKNAAEAFAARSVNFMRKTRWVVGRSNETATNEMAEIYLAALRGQGLDFPEVLIDPRLNDIDAGSWHGMTVDRLAESGRSEDAKLAAEYGACSFIAKPTDGTGESKLEVMLRAALWLQEVEQGMGDADVNLLVFAPDTFQNAVEVLLRCYPEKTPAQVFSKSHLRHGEAHQLTEYLRHISNSPRRNTSPLRQYLQAEAEKWKKGKYITTTIFGY